MRFNHKIKGSIMGLVLMTSTLVTLMSAFLILRAQLDTQTHFLYEENDRLLNNARSGLEWLMSADNPVPLNQSMTVDLYGEACDSVYLERKTWGVFEIVLSKAFHGEKAVTKKALIGSRTTQDSTPTTLYVCDLGKAISMCGETRLKGKCYVPAGFKRAYIEGQNYTGDAYIYGTPLPSQAELPALDKNFVHTIELQLAQVVTNNDSVVNLASLDRDSLVWPFDKKTIVLQASPIARLTHYFLSGNIKIQAARIEVSSGCQLSNVLLLADEIVIDDDCDIQVQAFARKTISVGKKAILAYPSMLVVMSKTDTATALQEPQVFIGEESVITGDVIAWKEKKFQDSDAWLCIDKSATVMGHVYVNGRLDIKGNIYGSTYCTRFYLKTASGIYENHLLNAVLDASKLPAYYTGAAILREGSQKEILQWL